MKINRSSSAVWAGGLKDGKGAITTQSGALTDYPFGFSSRFEGIAGSNPEELSPPPMRPASPWHCRSSSGEVGLKAERMEAREAV